MVINFNEKELNDLDNLSDNTIFKLDQLCSELNNDGMIDYEELEEVVGDRRIIEKICDYIIYNKELDIDTHFYDDYKNIVSTNSFKNYLNKIRNYKVLSYEELLELFKRVENGDENAKNEIINHNLKLVVNISNNYLGKGLDQIDLIQEGNIGLMEAVNRFDYKLGYKFSTYATFWIKKNITRAIENKGRTVRLPVQFHSDLKKYNYFCSRYYLEYGDKPSNELAAKHLGLTVDKINEFKLLANEPVSLNSPMSDDSDASLEDFISIKDDDYEDRKFNDELRNDLILCLNNLNISDRNRYIIEERFGLTGHEIKTLEMLSQELGITRERIRKIENAILKQIKESKYCDTLKIYYSSVDLVNEEKDLLKEHYQYKSLKNNEENKRINDIILKLEQFNYSQDFDSKKFYKKIKKINTKNIKEYNKEIFDPNKYSFKESLILFIKNYYKKNNINNININKLIKFINDNLDKDINISNTDIDSKLIMGTKQLIRDLLLVMDVYNNEIISDEEVKRYLIDKKENIRIEKKNKMGKKFIEDINTNKYLFDNIEIQILYDYLGLNYRIISIPELCSKYNVDKDYIENIISRYRSISDTKSYKTKKLVLD